MLYLDYENNQQNMKDPLVHRINYIVIVDSDQSIACASAAKLRIGKKLPLCQNWKSKRVRFLYFFRSSLYKLVTL